jgi:hypothetical protein
MQKYADTNGDSGVVGYEIASTQITVWFEEAAQPYTYSYDSAGQNHVEAMKRLAAQGNGLNAYINRHVKSKYVG